MSRALVLFDIDGTLLITGGASSRCIWRAAEQVLKRSVRSFPLSSGTLDHQIFREIADRCDIGNSGEYLEAYKIRYVMELKRELQGAGEKVKVMPGVRELLRDLGQREDLVLGLLTGNFASAAHQKLEAAALDRCCFKVGAFAEHGNERFELVSAALKQFAVITGEGVGPERVILVGDTPRDVTCARRAGCRVLAVATGFYSLSELEAERPDVAVADLADPQPLYTLINQVLNHAQERKARPC